MLQWAQRRLTEDPPPLRPTPNRADERRADEWLVAPLIAYLTDRELLLPARLLGDGHQPLAFVVAQGCYLFTPLVDLLGLMPRQGWTAWIEQVMALTFGRDLDRGRDEEGVRDDVS